MENRSLSAPWRMEYIRTLENPDGDACFICLAAAAATDEERRKRLVLWCSEQCVAMINRYPYANGHLLVAPRAHKAELELLSDAEHLDMQKQTTAAVALLKRTVSAQGFNLGINVGRCAGAGLPGHIHQHIVPRWGGDTNFMSVVGDVRVIPEATGRLYDELLAMRKKIATEK